jgi:hypothetical protein
MELVTGSLWPSSGQRTNLMKAVPLLRMEVARLPPRRPGFSPSTVHMAFAVDKVILGQVSS